MTDQNKAFPEAIETPVAQENHWNCYRDIAATLWNANVRDPIAERASRHENVTMASIGISNGYNKLDDVYSLGQQIQGTLAIHPRVRKSPISAFWIPKDLQTCG